MARRELPQATLFSLSAPERAGVRLERVGVRLLLLIPLFVIVVACGPGEEEYNCREDETVINFPDPKMEGCIRSHISDTPGKPVLVKNVCALKSISCISSGITDLTGLEKMPWVKVLDLPGNPVTSLEPLTHSNDLEYLDIGGGQYRI